MYKSVEDRQMYNGKTFTRYKQNRYYWWKVSSNVEGYEKGQSVSMHRYIWQFHNGPIPDGYQIHHIDHDPSNNNISNLELVERKTHARKHAVERMRENPDKFEEFQKAGIEVAPAWHKSEAGKLWHKEHARKIARRVETHGEEKICTWCGKTFMGLSSATKRGFCSASCQGMARKQSGVDDIEKACPICDNIYRANKYQGRKTCSNACASEAIRRARTKRK